MTADDARDRPQGSAAGTNPPPEDRSHPDGRRTDRGVRIDPEAEAEHPPRRAVIAALVDHEPGVLATVAGLFSGRQFNIESLTVGPTTDPDRARLTVVVEEPDPGITQVEKQLAKLRSVHAVRELESTATRRELALLKVEAADPAGVGAMADMYDGQTVDAGADTITVEITGSRQKIDAAVSGFRRFGVREVVRTGTAALDRGPTTLPTDQRSVPDPSLESPDDEDAPTVTDPGHGANPEADGVEGGSTDNRTAHSLER